MANLIQNNSKLIEQVSRTQSSQTQNMQNSKREQSDDVNRQPKTIRITKDQSGFGFNVRGQISGKFVATLSKAKKVEKNRFYEIMTCLLGYPLIYPHKS